MYEGCRISYAAATPCSVAILFNQLTGYADFQSSLGAKVEIYEPQRENMYLLTWTPNENINQPAYPHSILHKSIAGQYRPVRVADGPITARCRFMKNASRESG